MHQNHKLQQEAILRGLQTKAIGRSLMVVTECSSTNDLAARYAQDGAAHGFTIIADQQSEGRGRLGRKWVSPLGGIWLTVLLRRQFDSDAWNCLPLIGALSVAKALQSDLNLAAQVRWPNDVVIGKAKLAGILVESKSTGCKIGYALLGIGINANFKTRILGNLAHSSTSLLDLSGFSINREKLICSILSELEILTELLSSNCQHKLLSLLGSFDFSTGKTVKIFEKTEIVGQFEGYETPTKVRIRTANGDLKMVETNFVVSVEYSAK